MYKIEFLLKLTESLEHIEVREERGVGMYKSKIDSFFRKVIAGSIILISAVFLIPYLIRIVEDIKVTVLETVLMSCFLLFSNLFILWTFLGIRYKFHDDYLFVKGGPVRSKIRYEHVTKVTVTYFSVGDTLGGYRVMSSRDGIEINYQTGMMDHIRIPPNSKERFIEELKKRALHVTYIHRSY